ncbi:MAG TPA: hypothetical protein VKT18_04095, partial [Acidimicrobiales bacterium]|nr:hypothetical protein [Acidimicrobiales bacterium]
IGYTTHHFAHQRIPPPGSTSALLTPTSPEPVYHADRDFHVSFSGGVARMTIGHHRVTVNATTSTLSYLVTRSGAKALSAASAPRCA